MGRRSFGLIASQCSHAEELHVDEQAVLLEQHDGATYATNLVNRIQPMIRLRLPERVELRRMPCSCGGSSLRLRLHGGRSTPILRLPAAHGGTVALHPIVLRTALDPLLLRRLPSVEWGGQVLRVTLEAEQASAAEQRLVAALARAGVDPGVLVVTAR